MKPTVPHAGERTHLRQHLLAARRALPGRRALEAALVGHLLALLARVDARCVGAYWPIRGEPRVLGAVRRWCTGVAPRVLALPVIEGERLGFAPWRRGEPLQADRYGIPSPTTAARVVPDWLLVPCVGVGAGGHRLGYGAGYYDRTLPQLVPQPRTIGVVFAVGDGAAFTPQPHDARLDWVVSEAGARAVGT